MIKLDWVIDPTTKQPSVSLTMLIATFLGSIVVGGLEVAGVTHSTSIFTEMFYSCCALYFSRRFNFNGKTYSSEKAQETINKIENINV